MAEDLAQIPLDQLTIEQLRERVGKGIDWLAKQDPDGHYNFHYGAHKPPYRPGERSPKAWSVDKIAGYRDYYFARNLYHELDALLEKREREAAK